MQEFIYYNEESLEFPLNESIMVTQSKEEGSFLISNSKEIQSEFYAPEIDFYIKNSQTDVILITNKYAKIHR